MIISDVPKYVWQNERDTHGKKIPQGNLSLSEYYAKCDVLEVLKGYLLKERLIYWTLIITWAIFMVPTLWYVFFWSWMVLIPAVPFLAVTALLDRQKKSCEATNNRYYGTVSGRIPYTQWL